VQDLLKMRASVIVITRNRPNSIPETLAALSRQTHPDFEVLVVDSSDAAEQGKTEAAVKQGGASYIFEPRRGQALARNAAVPLTTGAILVFTDDDCIPEPDWLAQKVQNFSDPAVWACTGRVIQHDAGGASGLFEEVAGQDLGVEKRIFTKDDIRFDLGVLLVNVTKVFAKHMKGRAPVPFGVGHGSSMAFRREAFRVNGAFDERYGWGKPFGGCEDIEILYRTLKSGHTVVYEPAAIVRHKHRFLAEEVFKTRYVYSYAGAAFMRQNQADALMVFMFYGRLLQLWIKRTQYRLLRNQDLAKSFGSDLRGYLDGWAAYRKYARESHAHPSNQPVKM